MDTKNHPRLLLFIASSKLVSLKIMIKLELSIVDTKGHQMPQSYNHNESNKMGLLEPNINPYFTKNDDDEYS